ncbi:MAG: dTDP-4-dehydrorhamnose 3,5-epimerase [Myxococcota bacterium]
MLPEVMLMTPRVFEDARGFFFESYHRARYLEAGIDAQFVQDNHARSQQGTLRGLHFQRRPGQAKLVRAVAGTVWDVAVDIRVGSSTFGRWEAWELDAARPQALFIPVGFAHGYVALRDAEVLYKVDAHYDPDEEKGFAWDDPDVGVRWPVAQPLVSARDREAPTLRTLFPRAF